MKGPFSNPSIPITIESLNQIQEDKNDDKRDSLEKMADIANNILQKISEINETPPIHHKPASYNLVLFYSISTINTFLLALEINEIFPYLIIRILTFATIYATLHFLWNTGSPQKNRFFLSIIAISANFLTSTVIMEVTGPFINKPFPYLCLEDHGKGFIKDSQSTILSLAIFLIRSNIKSDLLNLTIGYLGVMLSFNIFFDIIFLKAFFTYSCYIEISAWYMLSIIGMKMLCNQNKINFIEKQKKIDIVGNETKKVIDILSQVQNTLQENYDQMAPITISKADDLMRKLKFLKFQTLLDFKKNSSKSNTPANNVTKSSERITFASPTNKKKKILGCSGKGTQLLSPTYRRVSKSFIKKNSSVLDAQKAILIQKLEAYDFAPGGEKIKKDKRWSLTPEDVDDIMNGIVSKPSIFWLPNFLNQKKENDIKNTWFPKETKDFLISHFTDNSGKGFADDLAIIKQNTFELDMKFIDLNPLNDYLINVCENWNYDVFLLHTLTNGNVVVEFGYCIFRKFHLAECLKIENNSVVTNFLYNVQLLYRNNPYHNSMHAADVTNSIGFFLTKGMNKVFSQFEASCLVVSALAHDVGHPGLNNAFLVATKSKYAIIYNDSSVLENYHASSLFQILVTTKSDISSNLTEKEFRIFRKLCIGMILDTDLQKHFIVMNKFKNLLALGDFDMNDESNRQLALSVALKCADIGHGAKGLELHKKWSRRIIEEFFNQGDLELKHNMPISALCDRKSDIAKSQEGFLKCIVLPLYESFEQFAKSQIITQHCSEQIKKNLEYWDAQKLLDEKQVEKSFMEETKEVYNEIAKISSRVSDDSSSCLSCT